MSSFITNSNQNNNFSYKLFNSGFFILLIFGGLLLVALNNYFLPVYLANRYSTMDYLANLQNSEFGIYTYPYRDTNFDYLVIGDSHSYAGFNYNVMSEVLKTENIGAFNIGGLRFESIPELLRLMDVYDKYPKNIILGMSLLMLVDHENNSNRIKELDDLLNNIINPTGFDNINRENLFKIMMDEIGISKYDPSYLRPINYLDQKNKLDFHRFFIENINDSLIEMNHSVKDNESLAKLYSNFKFAANIENKIEEVFTEIKKRKINLFVIHIPESPLIENIYSDKLFIDYKKYLNKFGKYADKIVIEKSNYFNIKNKHFVNRYLNEVNYDNWSEIEINYDHLSYYGAVYFTYLALFHLGLSN